jgi:hypothetical protein
MRERTGPLMSTRLSLEAERLAAQDEAGLFGQGRSTRLSLYSTTLWLTGLKMTMYGPREALSGSMKRRLGLRIIGPSATPVDRSF